MSRAELYKIRSHHTPWVTAALLVVGVLASPAVLLFYTPSADAAYLDAFTATYSILAPLTAIVFGAWLLGTEYRQGTVKRMLTAEPRRRKALMEKAFTGAAVTAAALAATGVIGWGASWLVADMNGVGIDWNGRSLLGAGLFALAAGTLSFGAAAVTRSDSFAMIATTGLILVLDPLLSLVPRIGDYTFGNALSSLTDRVAGTADTGFGEAAALGTGSASATVAIWLVGVLGAGTWLFTTRDV